MTTATQRFFLFDFSVSTGTTATMIRAYSWSVANDSGNFVHIVGTNYVATSATTTLIVKSLADGTESTSTPMAG